MAAVYSATLCFAIVLRITSGSYLRVGTVPIPPTPHGIVYKGGMHSAPLQLEQFGEFLCKDVKKTWTVLKPVADYYGPSRLRLRLYQYPLPYHQYAFLATQVRNS